MSAFDRAMAIISVSPDTVGLGRIRFEHQILADLASEVDVFIASVIIDPYLWITGDGLPDRIEKVLIDNLETFGKMLYAHRSSGGSCDDILDNVSEILFRSVAATLNVSLEDLHEALRDDDVAHPQDVAKSPPHERSISGGGYILRYTV